MKPIKEDVGKRIEKIRENGNYSMEAFGKLINNSSRGTVNNWEKGKRTPNQDALEKIAVLGNTTVDKILYGELDEYLFNLVKQNLKIELNNQMISMIILAASPQKLSYNDDVRWLQGISKILETVEIEYLPTHLIYIPVAGVENLYIGQIQSSGRVEQSAYNGNLISLYYIFADISNNLLHVMPFPFNENKKELFFNPATFICEKGQGNYFTYDYEKINMQKKDSMLVTYGIDQKTLKKMYQFYKYDMKNDCYTPIPRDKDMLYTPFVDETEKEILRLKEVNE